MKQEVSFGIFESTGENKTKADANTFAFIA
jgi:hypothetical protein